MVGENVKLKDKDKANELLRFGILLCQGKGCKCPDNTRMALILSLIDDLACLDAIWQVQILRYHLHNALRKGIMTIDYHKKRGGGSKGSVLTWYKHVPDGSEGSNE